VHHEVPHIDAIKGVVPIPPEVVDLMVIPMVASVVDPMVVLVVAPMVDPMIALVVILMVIPVVAQIVAPIVAPVVHQMVAPEVALRFAPVIDQYMFFGCPRICFLTDYQKGEIYERSLFVVFIYAICKNSNKSFFFFFSLSNRKSEELRLYHTTSP